MPTQSRQKITIQDVAKATGAAKSTVSAAFTGKGRVSPERREEILRVARELGFEPNPHAQRLSNGNHNNTVALFSLDLDLGVGTHKLKIIQRLLAADGYDVPVYSYGSFGGGEVVPIAKLMDTLCRQRPRAIICFSNNLSDDVWCKLERYQSEGGIVVCFDFKVPLACDTVVFDREDNTYQAARHLLNLGHRKIGFYRTCPDNLPQKEVRFQGFCRALKEYGIRPQQEWLFHEGLDEEGGELMAKKFLELKHRPSAMCIVNDTAAAMFIIQLRKAGINVPEDVSVVSHDDTPIARCSAVPLTTATHPVEEIAHQVVSFLQSRLTGEYTGDPRCEVIRGKLITRQSCTNYLTVEDFNLPYQPQNGHKKEAVLC